MERQLVLRGAVGGVCAICAYLQFVRPWHQRWGATEDELHRTLPGDEEVPRPTVQSTRAITINAPVSDVWPWVAQVRLAPYSYDWIDNLGRRSPRQLVGLHEPQVGEKFTTAGGRDAWFGTGGDAVARVFHSSDRGQTWTVSATPMLSGPTAGINALAFRDVQHGLAVGGDFLTPTVAPNSLALSDDGGDTWELVADAPNQYRSGATWVTGREAIIVGPTGSDVTFDQGRSWQPFDSGSFHTVDCAGGHACWASGANGRVAYLVRTP